MTAPCAGAWTIAAPSLGMFFASLAASVLLMQVMKQDFLPADDTGRIQGNIQAANGTSFDQMAKYVQDVTKHHRGRSRHHRRPGQHGRLQRRRRHQQRPHDDDHAAPPERAQVHAPNRSSPVCGPKLSRVPGVNVFLTNPPTIRLGARGSRSNYQYTLQGLDQELLQEYSAKLMADLRARPGFVDITSDYEAAMPSVQVEIDRDRAAAFGVSAMQIQQALGSAFGGQRISQINTSSNQYEVIMELLPEYQRDAASLDRVYVTGSNGTSWCR
jgi:HAE1 family hydrophobic/amphiphilic exporter-1